MNLAKNVKVKKRSASVPAEDGGLDAGWMDDADFGLQMDEDGEEFDYYMMNYYFFEDFNLVQSKIRERWCDHYFYISIPLNTLAIVTKAAFELVYHMEHDLILDMRRIGIRDRDMDHYDL